MATPKVFIVSGASKGIGAAVVKHLLSHSHKVVLAARSQDLLETVKKAHPDQVEYVAGDMTSPGMGTKLTELAVKSFGRLDGMVINHGILESKRFQDLDMDSFKKIYDVNVFSCVALAKAGLEELRKTKGCIVWVSSGAGVKAYQSWTAYGSSKAAVNSISEQLAVEEPDITSIAVAPGRVDTDMQTLIRAEAGGSMDKATYDNFVEAHAEGKLLKPEQPGNVLARFVANPDKKLSGKYTNWNDPDMVQYQDTQP